jgi:hypothetical protein
MHNKKRFIQLLREKPSQNRGLDDLCSFAELLFELTKRRTKDHLPPVIRVTPVATRRHNLEHIA